MEFRDLKQQYQVLKSEIDMSIQNVLTNCNFIGGSQVEILEKQLADYVGAKHCITCGNGTDALMLMLMAWNIKCGDAVFVPDFTFFATGEVVSFLGATPIFVDVEDDTYNINPICLEEAIKEVIRDGKLTPKAVIPVDLFGLPANYDAITAIAEKYGLWVLEDGAQGFGGKLNGQHTCSFGDAATTSFFPAKPLGSYGDGGAIFTNIDETDNYLRSVCTHGKGSMKYDNVRIGINSRLDSIQAAILQVKLKAFQKYELADVNKVASWYTNLLQSKVKTPIIPKGYSSSWAQYTIQLENREQRNAMQKELKKKGISTMIYYPKPLHSQKAFANLPYDGSCPITEKLCNTVLSLPMHPYLKKCDVELISEEICDFLQTEDYKN